MQTDNIENLRRLKQNVPFSYRLNSWLKNWFETKKEIFEFTEIDDFDNYLQSEYLRKIVKDFQDTGIIKVWIGDSENSIFGEQTVNHYFRAWHDYNHIAYYLDFSLEAESLVASLQMAELPRSFHFEKQLIFADVVGQNLYHHKHAKFPTDQRNFVIDFLTYPNEALNFADY